MKDKLVINTNLNYKASSYVPDKCVVERVVEISGTDFKRLLAAPLEDKEYIKQYCELMRTDDDGTSHCILVVDHHSGDGLLIESEGYNYARYSQHIPHAREIVKAYEQTLAFERLKTSIDGCIDRLIRQHKKDNQLRVTLEDIFSDMDIENSVIEYAWEKMSNHPQIADCLLDIGVITAKKHELTETKLYCPLKFLYSPDDNSDLEDVPSSVYTDYVEKINKKIQQSLHFEDDLRERGLIEYSDNKKVHSAIPSVETKNGDLYGVITVKSYGELNEAELADLVNELTGQLSDGWGEGFEQREIMLGDDKVFISFWNSEDFYLKPESEVFPEQKCEQTIGGLN